MILSLTALHFESCSTNYPVTVRELSADSIMPFVVLDSCELTMCLSPVALGSSQ